MDETLETVTLDMLFKDVLFGLADWSVSTRDEPQEYDDYIGPWEVVIPFDEGVVRVTLNYELTKGA